MAIGPYNSPETLRLEEDHGRVRYWKRWGSYLPERQWGTVREDYSANGSSWTYLSHDHARSRTYRWGEDGLLGLTDSHCRLCFSVALWNGRDPILKERLFGLTGPEGNHAEDVKECYYYLDNTATHSYMKALYKYPQTEFPYRRLIEENSRRGRLDREFDLIDSGIFDNNEYFDVFVEYAKADCDDVLIKITIHNRAAEAKTIHVLPTLWFRNTWAWGSADDRVTTKPILELVSPNVVRAKHEVLGTYHFAFDTVDGAAAPTPLFTENETNRRRVFLIENETPFVKDAFHEYVIHKNKQAVNPAHVGTKFAPHHVLEVPAGKSVQINCRLSSEEQCPGKGNQFGAAFENVFKKRIEEADEFYKDGVIHPSLTPEEQMIARQAYAGLLWNKQFYHYVPYDWFHGDEGQMPPPAERMRGRNRDWQHAFHRDVISMPDKWEYPWFAAWDLAFHMIPFSDMDAHFAKEQMNLLLRESYLHPNGQIPAYEFNFSDVNPPVHAWATWHIYKSERYTGQTDKTFLETVFQKLLLNFTWWVNRTDYDGSNLFGGGFLGLDNIGAFDRSQALPTGGHLEQADGTAWMSFYCLNMLRIAIELAQTNPVYEDLAIKFFEHFTLIADAMNKMGGTGLWHEQDGFYYDQIKVDGKTLKLQSRSLVGLLPLIAVQTLEVPKLKNLPRFEKRMNWFLNYRRDLAHSVTYCNKRQELRLLAIPSQERLCRLLHYMLDENEFLSPYGIRSLSYYHKDHPYIFNAGGTEHRVSYVPDESDSALFGGNSNWRGPIWFPLNYLIVESLVRYYHFYSDTLKIECPTGSGNMMNLWEVSQELSRRLSKIFVRDKNGDRPCHGGDPRYAKDPSWRDLILYYEYFNPETGRGLGASHQTGWTALIADLLARERWDRMIDGQRIILEAVH